MFLQDLIRAAIKTKSVRMILTSQLIWIRNSTRFASVGYYR